MIAPDSFKGTATATQAALAIAAGWVSVRPADDIRLLPMADGGEGTLEAFECAVAGAKRMPVEVQGPGNISIAAYWLLLPDGTGVVELANTSGITLLEGLDPLNAHTFGFGQAIADALGHGVERLLLAIGGSASTDGGAGMLAALGASMLDATNRPIRLGNRGLGALARLNLGGVAPLPPGGAIILSDVTNPLLGEFGAAAVFGPQKGASAAQVGGLESNLRRWERMVRVSRVGSAVRADPAAPGSGAAGGTGFGLQVWGATLAPRRGAAVVGEALGLPAAVEAASVVITGEGRYDSQSASGKVPSYVAGLAAERGLPAMLVAGDIDAAMRGAAQGDGTEPFGSVPGFVAVESLTALAGGSAAAMADPLTYLRMAGAALARRV